MPEPLSACSCGHAYTRHVGEDEQASICSDCPCLRYEHGRLAALARGDEDRCSCDHARWIHVTFERADGREISPCRDEACPCTDFDLAVAPPVDRRELFAPVCAQCPHRQTQHEHIASITRGEYFGPCGACDCDGYRAPAAPVLAAHVDEPIGHASNVRRSRGELYELRVDAGQVERALTDAMSRLRAAADEAGSSIESTGEAFAALGESFRDVLSDPRSIRIPNEQHSTTETTPASREIAEAMQRINRLTARWSSEHRERARVIALDVIRAGLASPASIVDYFNGRARRDPRLVIDGRVLNNPDTELVDRLVSEIDRHDAEERRRRAWTDTATAAADEYARRLTAEVDRQMLTGTRSEPLTEEQIAEAVRIFSPLAGDPTVRGVDMGAEPSTSHVVMRTADGGAVEMDLADLPESGPERVAAVAEILRSGAAPPLTLAAADLSESERAELLESLRDHRPTLVPMPESDAGRGWMRPLLGRPVVERKPPPPAPPPSAPRRRRFRV